MVLLSQFLQFLVYEFVILMYKFQDYHRNSGVWLASRPSDSDIPPATHKAANIFGTPFWLQASEC